VVLNTKPSSPYVSNRVPQPNDHDHEGPLRTTELNIVELDTSGNYVIKYHIIKKIFGKLIP
jgi:hypothetical protein